MARGDEEARKEEAARDELKGALDEIKSMIPKPLSANLPGQRITPIEPMVRCTEDADGEVWFEFWDPAHGPNAPLSRYIADDYLRQLKNLRQTPRRINTRLIDIEDKPPENQWIDTERSTP